MSQQRCDAESLVEALEVRRAAESTLHRWGVLQQEVERRSAVRAMVRSSRELSQALDKFAGCAAAHADGNHCSSRMDEEVARLEQALGDFVFAMQHAAACSSMTSSPAADVEVPLANARPAHANWLPLRNPALPPIVHAGGDVLARPS